ncbi:TonB-dependent receptor [Pollutibacter soli]|uniref:SusC/RagA family TonB-linked outer membrane protein n=1 Tax=Pollutibacter soli TaxID=3034157 RepID=UPI0030137C28
MSLKKLLLSLVIILGFTIAHTYGQSVVVTGKITSAADQKPISGASVILKGTQTGTTSDTEGNFKITSPTPNGFLVISNLGYGDLEVPINSRTIINVSLTPGDNKLEDVVVIGYGTRRKRDLSGSVATVKGRDINAFPATNVMQALSGRAAGVQVLQNTGAPGAGVSVRIRGANSIRGSNEPLYVVDGFPVSGSPTILNNPDIESIEILKDASATAIYGSRGANGVVMITTRKGRSGKTNVDIETSYGIQSLRKKLDLMNAQEYAQFYNLQATNDNIAPYFTEAQIAEFANKSYDWQDLVFQNAPMKTLSATVSGGNEKTNFSVSGGYFGQEGIIKGSNYDRYSLRVNLNHEISKKFSFNVSSVLSRINTDRKNNGGGNRGASMISAAISAPPTLTPYNDDGTYRVLATAYPFISNVMTNPLNFINEQTDEVRANRVLANASLSYRPIPEITIKFLGGIENADDRTDQYTTKKYINSQGVANVSTVRSTSLLSENTISYNKLFGSRHNVSAVAGFTYQNFLNTSLSAGGTGFISDNTQTYDLAPAATPGLPGSSYTKSVIMSWLGRANYILDDKYIATISFRADGSSKYSAGNKWGYFPSGALAWRISNEKFMKNVEVISDMKLRVGWGLTGSEAINPYATLNQLFANKATFDAALFTSYAPGTVLPGNLRWETTEQRDIGIDIAFFKNRLTLAADYYVKNTRDLLNTVALPSSLGFTSTVQNVGEIQNKGVELTVGAGIFQGEFRWDVNANISFNRNKVVKLYNNEDILGGFVGVTAVNDNANILRVGRPVGQFWGYVEDGYNDAGKIKYVDINKDGAFNANDKTYIGDPNPDFIYGFNSFMSYKNFDFNFFIQGSQGNDLFNVSSINNTIDYGFGLNMPKDVFLNHWTPTNTNAKYPIISRTAASNVSTRWIEDGSYLRLRNVQLAYNFRFGKSAESWIRNLQVYVSGQNLITITKYSWWDPEVNSNGGANSTSQGFDYYSYPPSKMVTFGIRAGF